MTAEFLYYENRRAFLMYPQLSGADTLNRGFLGFACLGRPSWVAQRTRLLRLGSAEHHLLVKTAAPPTLYAWVPKDLLRGMTNDETRMTNETRSGNDE